MNTMPLPSVIRAALASIAGATTLASGLASAASAPDLSVVEYFHRPTAHYFITATPSEQTQLDALPASVGFARTGRSFSAWSTALVDRPLDAVAVERFFVPALSSHVFTASPKEILALRALPLSSSGAGFVDEGVAFYALQPVNGRCASGLKAIYRAYNNRHDGNHRYTTDLSLQAVMVSGGYVNEDVAFCSNVVGENASAEKSAGTPRPVGEDLHLAGAVSAFVSLSEFMVGSQRVNAANARFDHGAPSALVNGVSVAVEGVIVNGVLMAKEISLPSSTPLSGDEIKGFINAVGSNGGLFVNGVSVDISGATITGGTAAQLVVGVELELHGAFLNGVFMATLVHIEDASSSNSSSSSSGDAELEGAVSNFVSISNFTVQGQVVDASSAVFEDGTAADVAKGAVVEVHGRIVSGVLVASRVEIKSGGSSSSSGEAEVEGAVSNFVSISNFTVGGQVVDASGAVFEDGTAADVANGAVVEVHGRIVAGVLVASRVEIKSGNTSPPPGAGVEFEEEGAISDFVSVASFKLAGVLIDASTANFERGTAANLRNGVLVEIKGVLTNGVVKATRVRFED
ncbi:MAG: DUF5666 domain-containing protein [Casimicrobium sp.]